MNKFSTKFLFGLFSLTLTATTMAGSRPIFTDDQEDAFAQIYSSKYDIPERFIKQTLSQAVFQPRTYQLEQIHHVNTTEPQNIDSLNRRVRVSQAMVHAGQKFMCQHQDALAKAKQMYGIPPNYIVGILGVETLYGRFVGNYRELDTLTTLAFNSPERTAFFQDELAQYLVMCYKNELDPTAMISSIDGGFGLSQFMPSSYNKFAVSTTRNAPNLFSANDAIMSVAHYLKEHNWKFAQKNLAAIYSYNHSLKYTFTVYQLGNKVVKQTSRSGC
jgi:membrane-bound lytic murein transglycosylase B